MADVYDTGRVLVCAGCLAPQNSLCGFVTDFRLCHEFAFRFKFNTYKLFELAPARLTVPFLSVDVRIP